ncbi:hypothetical protein U9M48_043781, partial [Paspalum notatum var. saurae]
LTLDSYTGKVESRNAGINLCSFMPQKGQSGTESPNKSSGPSSWLASKGDDSMVKNDSGNSLSTMPPQHTQCHTGCRTEHRRMDALHRDSVCLSLQMAASGISNWTGAEHLHLSKTKFWSDRWLQGKTAAEVAPNLIKLIPKRAAKQQTVAQGLFTHNWVRDIRGALTVPVLLDYLKLWDMTNSIVLHHEVQDQHIWRLTRSGCYSSKSAYDSLEQNLEILGATEIQVWALVLHKVGLSDAAPLPDTFSFLHKEFKKGLNTLIMLVAWELCKHRNACVFEGARPCVQVVLQAVSSTTSVWCLAGAAALHKLLLWSVGPDSNPKKHEKAHHMTTQGPCGKEM